MNEFKDGTFARRFNCLQTPETIIDWFDDFSDTEFERNQFSFLSNFYIGEPIKFGGYEWQTGEHLYQAHKSLDGSKEGLDWFHAIRLASDPQESKTLGRNAPLRSDWEEVKFEVMRLTVKQKFNNFNLAKKLLDTGNAYLQEGTLWNDTIWGVDLTSSIVWHERVGTNWLGIILMEQRSYLNALMMDRFVTNLEKVSL
jgi:ribA/ribD-fused uncharacterized protein